jgi:HAD superfamily hydrolase (TIGR01490 family)
MYNKSMQKFAVFDIDGTLIRWQLYHSLIDKLAKQGQLGQNTSEIIHDARMRWKRRESTNSFSDYEKLLVEIYENGIEKLNPADVDKMVVSVIEQYKEQTYTFTRDLIKDLKQKGYLLFAISGSQTELVKKLAELYEFDDYLGTSYERKGGKFTGRKLFPAADKGVALKSLVEKHSVTLDGSYAVGDSKSDASMMNLVENPIAFNPDQELFNIASQNHWPVVIERKNVVYRLNYKDGTYKLTR